MLLLFLPLFQYLKFRDVFDDTGRLRNPLYDKRVKRFIEEFEWYIDAFKNQRAKRYIHIEEGKFSISRLQQKTNYFAYDIKNTYLLSI